jgi:hypothetical protein
MTAKGKPQSRGKALAGWVRAWAAQWGIRIAAAAILIATIYGHLHIEHDPVVVLSIVLVLVLFLSEQMHHAHSEIERQLITQDQRIEQLTKNAQRRLFGLRECVEDLSERLRAVGPGETVVMEHFGLDLTYAWQYFYALFREHPNLSRVDYRLLIISDDPDRILGANDEVRSWSDNVRRTMRDNISRDVASVRQQLQKQGRRLDFEMRMYEAVPALHGFRVVAPIKVCYLAFCRWGGDDYERYEWGEPQYHRIVGVPQDAVERDLLAIYDGCFQHAWREPQPQAPAAPGP